VTSSWSIVAVVDDLTGAIEVGAKFAAYGLPAIVTTDVSSLSEEQHVPVVVIDTETRHLNSNEAAERTSLAAAFACRSSARLI
jgi:uncharacterized protein YgbK (DUF1537 family)